MPQQVLTLGEFQVQLKVWTDHNFADADSSQPLMGLFEELGELATVEQWRTDHITALVAALGRLSHAHLKTLQNIRNDENHRATKIDSVADVIVFLGDYCNREGIDMQEAFERTWLEVRKRNWRPEKGDVPTFQ